MLLPLLAAAAIGQSNVQTVELYRGAKIEGISPRYWEVEDTTLDSTASDLNQGWQTELDGGPGKTILIQFTGLNRALGPHKKIVSASIVFRLISGNNISLTGAGEVLQPWNQGPVKTLLDMNPSNAPTPGAIRAATWRHRRLGGASWEHVGATGEHDSTALAGVTVQQPDAEHLQVDGLASAIQRQYDQPWNNHGFVFQFASPVAFVSSQSGRFRPRLVLKVEDAAPKTGPNLTIAYIERKPEYERYENEVGVTVQNQDGAPVPILDHPQNALTQKWPAEKDPLVYVAHVKNVGDAPANGFTATWFDDEKPAAPTDVAQTLQPGEEVTLGFHLPYKTSAADHRLQPVSLLIQPKGADAGNGNKFLEIYQSALNIGVHVEKGFYDAVTAKENSLGTHSFEDWIQSQVWLMNHVYFPYSRFSFAPDGVTETLRIQRIDVVPDGSLQGPHSLPSGKPDLHYDAELGFRAADAAAVSPTKADMPLLRSLALQLGMVDFGALSFPANDPHLTALETGGIEDMYPDFLGGGDTRNDAQLPPSIPLPYQPYPDEVVQQSDLQSTDLLSATNVAEMQTDLGKRRGYQGDVLYDAPAITVLTVVDYNGLKMPLANLTFYQMVNGSFPANARAIKAKTNEDGIVNLFKRDILAGFSDEVATGHELKPNPFGRIDYRGLNDTFLVKVEWNGSVGWGALKLWQLTDSLHRGQQGIVLLKMAVNMPSDAVDETADLFKGKMAASSAGATVSFDGVNETALPSETGSWIEIDLGRDRTIGEIKFLTKSANFWKNFEFRTYETGQKVSDSLPWAQELNWDWSYRNRIEPDGSMAYCGQERRFRYLRIINKGPATEAKLAGIKILPVKNPSP